ncbi:MAG: SDR family NAD(P)-dependent oxidoreductase, partial [Solirubrobacterales bacterium]
MNDTSRPLAGKVALVAGATRGAGRGTAVALGEAGATVYCTGRSTRERRSEYDRPETIEETAALVDAAGGRGIAVAADHLVSDQVRALVARIDAEQGHLDVLVNDIWGGELLFEWDTPVWEHDLENGLRMLRLAIDTHLITSHFALALLIRRPGGLVVEMTDGTLEYNAANYRLSTFYDLAKTAVTRLAFAQGK